MPRYRMRQIGKGQALHLVLVDETLELIRKRGGVTDSTSVTFESCVESALSSPRRGDARDSAPLESDHDAVVRCTLFARTG